MAAALAAVALCLGGALTAAASGGGDGYVAVGAAGSGPDEAPSAAVPPKGRVVLVPLDGATAPGGAAGKPPADAREAGRRRPASGPGRPGVPARRHGRRPPAAPGAPGGTGGTSAVRAAGPAAPAAPGGSGGSGSGGARPTARHPRHATRRPRPHPPPDPAVLTLGAPVRAAAGRALVREGDRGVPQHRRLAGASGTVTFATHIIGALGIDWATIESTSRCPRRSPREP